MIIFLVKLEKDRVIVFLKSTFPFPALTRSEMKECLGFELIAFQLKKYSTENLRVGFGISISYSCK